MLFLIPIAHFPGRGDLSSHYPLAAHAIIYEVQIEVSHREQNLGARRHSARGVTWPGQQTGFHIERQLKKVALSPGRKYMHHLWRWIFCSLRQLPQTKYSGSYAEEGILLFTMIPWRIQATDSDVGPGLWLLTRHSGTVNILIIFPCVYSFKLFLWQELPFSFLSIPRKNLGDSLGRSS